MLGFTHLSPSRIQRPPHFNIVALEREQPIGSSWRNEWDFGYTGRGGHRGGPNQPRGMPRGGSATIHFLAFSIGSNGVAAAKSDRIDSFDYLMSLATSRMEKYN